MSKQQRKVIVTFLAAGLGAVIVDHLITPKVKKGFKI